MHFVLIFVIVLIIVMVIMNNNKKSERRQIQAEKEAKELHMKSPDNMYQELKKLGELKATGVISEQEFERLKKEAIDRC